MIISKQIKASTLAIILVTVSIASFSSFVKGDPAKPKAKKAGEIKVKHAELTKTNGPNIYHTYYWDESTNSWVNSPVGECLGNGVVCSVGWNNAGSGGSVAQQCANASAAYAATGRLSDPSVNQGSVTINGVVYAVSERAPL